MTETKGVIKSTIYGTTTINHLKRTILQLTCDEYVILEFMRYCEIHKKVKTWDYLRNKTGFEKTEFNKLLQTLILKGFVNEIDLGERKVYETSNKWNSSFEVTDEEFEIFWKWDKYYWPGSKSAGKAKYLLVRKKYSADYLLDRRNAYLTYLKKQRVLRNFDQAIMNCAKFLGKDEHFLIPWEDLSKKLGEVESVSKTEVVQKITLQDKEKLFND